MSPRRRVVARWTRDGVAFGVFLSALLGVSWISGNNLLYLIVAALLSLGLVHGLVGWWNISHVRVQRRLPLEAFEGTEAWGQLELINRWPQWPVFGLWVEELSAARGKAWFGAIGAEQRDARRVGWRFDRRGLITLPGVRVRSLYPFGLLEFQLDQPLLDQMWAYPRPEPAFELSDDDVGKRVRRGDEPDELDDLRPFRAGDRVRDVHWPTSARVGEPMVAVRAGRHSEPIWIDVRAATGEELEAELRRACGAVLEGFRGGRPVGMRIGGEVLPPQSGAAWRQRLLTLLAATPAEPR